MSEKKEKVNISTEYIKLDQLLKFSGAVSIGSEAKAVINGGTVSVNGEICTARGKKIREGDVIRIDSDGVSLVLEVGRE